MLKVGGLKKIDFAGFVQSLKLDSSCLMLLDNASIHKNLFADAEPCGVQLPEFCFVPPYTPELNPIENVFHALKSRVRKLALQRNSSLSAEIEQCQI